MDKGLSKQLFWQNEVPTPAGFILRKGEDISQMCIRDRDNKVSLFVRYIDIATGKYETKIVNKNR